MDRKIIDISKIIETITSEISLEGLEGCNLQKLFELLKPHENELNTDVNDKNIQQFIWNLVLNQKEFNFYQIKNKNNSEKPKVIKDNENRGFCKYYNERTCINSLINDDDDSHSFKTVNKEILTTIIIVSSQFLRDSVLCPSYKNLYYENITDVEYSVLETIAKSRKNGIFTTGDGSLTQIFEMVPKQLHYVLTILCKHEFIEKKTVSSQKQRSIVYLKRFEQKSETNLEKIVNYLNKKNGKQEYTHVIKEKFALNQKQFKNLSALGEKQNIFKRITTRIDVNNSTNIDEMSGDIDEDDDEDDDDDDDSNKKSKQKTKCVRLIKLTGLNSLSINNTNNNNDDDDGFDDNDSNFNDVTTLCSEQKCDLPVYTQIFKYIESCAHSGVSLKRLGNVFGFDFYKSRRIGAHLQTHPDVITLVKETDRGKAKYQTIIMKKFLNNNKTAEKKTSSNQIPLEIITASAALNVKNMESKPIQALASERSTKRRQIILDFLDKHKICSKFEIDKEIRRLEELEKLKGQIDSKTTKRMLLQLQSESKLKVFEFKVKDKIQTGVCLASISDTDHAYLNYLSSFSRSFDFCINNRNLKNVDQNSSINQSGVVSVNEAVVSVNEASEFKLTRPYIQSIIDKLEFSFQFAKYYGLASKIQKSIILHRFIHYILYFNNNENSKEMKATNYDFLMEYKISSTTSQQNKFNFRSKNSSSNINYSNIQPPPSSSSAKTTEQHKRTILTKECEIVNSSVPTACYNSKELSWKTFIPPLKINESVPKGCLFISDILSCMPLSIFCSIIAINYKIPGLLSLLKHPYKRHILIKDLPSETLAAFIYDRRHLQRILSNLQLLACLNLVDFVEHPTIQHQSPNRSVESQMIFVSRETYMRDTTENRFLKWTEIDSFNRDEYKKIIFKFDKDDAIIDFWKCLLNISLNTYKFPLGSDLKESKKLRALLHKQACRQKKISELTDLKPISGDFLGPGGYDSQLFLNSYANWSMPTTNSKSDSSDGSIPSLDYPDKIDNIHSELVMQLPFGILRGINPSSTPSSSRKRKAPAKRSKIEDDDDEVTMSDTLSDVGSPVKKTSRKILPYISSPIKTPKKKQINKISISSQEESPNPKSHKKTVFKIKTKNIVSIKTKTKSIEFKQNLAKDLIKKAKQAKIKRSKEDQKPVSTVESSELKVKSAAIFKHNSEQRRAVWNKEEDDLILLIKIASLYFLPNEKTVQFKIIHDIMNDLMPSTCGKKVKSFGRRLKVLLKSKLNRLYISNKLELCKQNDELVKLYSNVKLKRNSIANQNEQIGIYKRFILDIKSKLNTNLDDLTDDFKLPDTIDELYKKYSIKSQNDIFKQESFFKQPENDNEIIKSTLHSAIHSSILINDKTPREYESSKLFEQYKDNLLTEVINVMSTKHNIIAPTKCSEMKKKSITAFSKHVGRAYHISQRYQYKWLNNTPATIFNDAKKFRNRLVSTKQLDCTDLDDAGMTCYLAHTLEDKNLDVKIEVPNKIWVSKLL